MNIKAFIKRMHNAMHDPERKKIKRIISEYFWLKLTKPLLAEQYFLKFLFRTDAGDFYNYINTNRLNKKYWNINKEEFFPAFAIKNNFEAYLSQYNINVVKNLAYNHNALFFKDGTLKLISSPEEFFDFLSALPIKRAVFIKKKEDSFGGKDIFRVKINELKEDKILLEKIYNQVIKAGYVFQDEIVQHEDMNRLNPNCINCVRVVTYTNKQQKSAILGINQKTSLGNNYVDNIGAGGGYIPVDINTGILRDKIYTPFVKGGKRYYKHPVTGIDIDGFEIPYFKEVKELALKAARAVPEIILVGWDIAIQPDGPAIIEGNVRPGINDHEIVQKGYRNNPVYLDMLKDAGEEPIYAH
ncbi:MAG: sugar-transfer associated ATP-grasp domain-containing protein [Bacteroidota bacterium]